MFEIGWLATPGVPPRRSDAGLQSNPWESATATGAAVWWTAQAPGPATDTPAVGAPGGAVVAGDVTLIDDPRVARLFNRTTEELDDAGR